MKKKKAKDRYTDKKNRKRVMGEKKSLGSINISIDWYGLMKKIRNPNNCKDSMQENFKKPSNFCHSTSK